MANFIFYSVGHNILDLYNISVQLRLFTSNTSLASVVTDLKYELPDELVNNLRLIIVFGNTRRISNLDRDISIFTMFQIFYPGLLFLNPLSANFTKWSNTLKQLSVFDHFVGLALKWLIAP